MFATARKLESMKDLATIATNMTLLSLDVTSQASIKSAVESIQKELGPSVGLDLLVNNAGIMSNLPALDHDLNHARKIFETNVFGMMAMVQQFMPLLMLSDDACIVNIGSTAARSPFPFGTTYNASKAAVHGYSDTLRIGRCLIDCLRIYSPERRASTIQVGSRCLWMIRDHNANMI